MMKKPPEDPYLTSSEKAKLFFVGHWRGVIALFAPIILILMLTPFPPQKHQWTAYTLLLMAIYWVSECIPLAVTSFVPVIIFPLTDVADTRGCCRSYMNDSIMMFNGSLILAYSVEQSGLHKRLAYFSIRLIGYSHLKLLMAMCCVTTFASMWITNTAATTMMVPINFALLRVFEDQKVIVVYEQTPDGDKVASDTTVCYFCAATFSATVGGIGTLVGTGTNLVFKGLFMSSYHEAPEYLSFPKFSACTVPLMILLELCVYMYMVVLYFGFLRPGSDAARKSKMPEAAQLAAKAAIAADVKKRGAISFWETWVCLLFGGAMVLFFCRSPQLFFGWGDAIHAFFDIKDTKFVRDSALAMCVGFLMFLLPRSLELFKNFTAKDERELPRSSQKSLLDWRLLNSQMPFAFSFLLGGGFSLSGAAKSSGLNAKLGESMQSLAGLPNMLVLLIVVFVVVLVTNFASNVAVCNVFTPIAMQLAREIGQNPLWYCIASGIAASFCFLIPVGTPGNLIVQSAASVPTSKMIVAGFGPTCSCIVVTWLMIYYWAPVIWPDLKILPEWIK
ncbi:protein I'm not dead yet-like [Trichoplusia ni]|uniref:Protein I'm not dead yet-like n=1 Tax=Trichoplusia ni TaxID=7111 RepID=A0A7E5V9V1_TRINI|nr:protein I'm not dead yet-like [Trichoplusia ni]